jgi:hypothetical protein
VKMQDTYTIYQAHLKSNRDGPVPKPSKSKGAWKLSSTTPYESEWSVTRYGRFTLREHLIPVR